MVAEQARVTPGGIKEIGVINAAFCWLGSRVLKTRSANLFTVMGRRRRMFKAWLLFAATLMPGGRLPRRESELVILRVAARRACAYELDYHVRIGHRAGLTAEEITRVQRLEPPLQEHAGQAGSEQGGLEQWGLRDAVLIRAADSLVETKGIDDQLWGQLRQYFDDAELVELTMLAAHYDMLATFITTLGIQPDTRPSR